jgi:hypothetical protein
MKKIVKSVRAVKIKKSLRLTQDIRFVNIKGWEKLLASGKQPAVSYWPLAIGEQPG